MESFLTRLGPISHAAFRVVVGFLFACHGAQKLFGMFGGFAMSPTGKVEVVSLLGVAAIIELVGGLLVALGVRARLAAFICSGEMAAAYFMAHQPQGCCRSRTRARPRCSTASRSSCSPVSARGRSRWSAAGADTSARMASLLHLAAAEEDAMDRSSQLLLCILAVAVTGSCRSLSTETAPQNPAVEQTEQRDISDHGAELLKQGREVFRYDTFGAVILGRAASPARADRRREARWHGSRADGRQALAAGLKVDVAQLPKILYEAIRGGSVISTPRTPPSELLKANAVVGLTGKFDDPSDRLKLTGIGIQCALCHSTVDDSLVKGIGRRLDGWPNRDLDVGAIIALAPSLAPYEKALQKDDATVRKVLRSWGPGRYDAELNQDGRAFRPDGKTGATCSPRRSAWPA